MESKENEQPTRCMVCKQAVDEDLLVLCDGCDNAYHTYCMTGCECCGKVPNRQFKKVMEVPEGKWYCKHCRDHMPALPEGETPKTVMYGWGNNVTHCLGSGLKGEQISTPTQLTEVEGDKVIDFAVGADCTVALDDNGRLYTCGDGNTGVLGFQDVVHESLDHLRRVDFFQSSKISKGEGHVVSVFSSGNNIIAVTKNGHMYGWGENSNGELGHMDYKPKRLPKKNSAFRELNVQVKQVAVGAHHTLVLGDDMKVYCMGENTSRQLGVSNNSIEWSPKLLCAEWKHDRTYRDEPDFPGAVHRIFAGGNSSMCIDRKGYCYVWGNDILHLNESSETSNISFMNNHSIISYPMKVDILDHINMKDIAIGMSHMLVLDTQGNVYAAGDNSKGQLGLGKQCGLFVKKLTKIASLPAGMQGIFAVDDVSGCYGPDGFYMWGDVEHPIMPKEGEISENRDVPKKVKEWTNVMMVKASSTHIIVMCEAISKKREAEPVEESDAKKVKTDA